MLTTKRLKALLRVNAYWTRIALKAGNSERLKELSIHRSILKDTLIETLEKAA